MGVFSTVSIAVICVGFLAAIFVRYAINECREFQIGGGSQQGKVILVTGANSGLGYHTSLVLAKRGATVIMACRSKSKCEDAKQKIIDSVPAATVETAILDLSSFQSIRDFSASFIATHDHLDVLINNAGIMAIPTRETTVDGLELQIGTNHFGHFLLTSQLLPIIAKNGRIINHSSGAHSMTSKDFYSFNDTQRTLSYDPWTAYGNSKAANLLFTYELNKRLAHSPDMRDIISIAVHPGFTSTNLQTDRFPLHEHINNFFAMSGEDGALAQIQAAIDPSITASFHNYLGPKYFMLGAPALTATNGKTWGVVAQDKLWKESVRLTGENFGGI